MRANMTSQKKKMNVSKARKQILHKCEAMLPGCDLL